ncbi:MAG: dephospho-CoA kinase [Deltaproteobacteria bacterium RBG_13_52_11b]|nr:MAG: dephospho-CoA kinase [Deltaproteobacteria bacterium RBG_13_52_11b]
MLIVGLTGGVASGKSVVSEVLRKEGAYVIDADQIARELVEPHSPGWKELKSRFGDEILGESGAVQRKKLAAKVFSDPEQRKILEQILHPRIGAEIERRTKEIGRRDPGAIVVIDAALIVERGEYREMDKLIVVTSTEEQQVQRLEDREGARREEAMRILAAQVPLQEKLRVADYVIRNEGLLEETRRRAKEVFRELKRIALEKDRR